MNGSDDKPIQRAIDDAAYGDDSDSDLGGTDGDFRSARSYRRGHRLTIRL